MTEAERGLLLTMALHIAFSGRMGPLPHGHEVRVAVRRLLNEVGMLPWVSAPPATEPLQAPLAPSAENPRISP